VNLAQSWAVIVTPSALIGWLYHDGEDKIRLSALPQITTAPGGQWWPESLSWLLFRWPMHGFKGFIGLKKICHYNNLLALVSFYTYGLSWLKYMCYQVTAAEHAANSCDSQLHFWTNWWASLCFPCLKWIKWGRQAHSPISEKEGRETWAPRGSYYLFSFY
jgi:hypothetical protein